MDSTKILLVEDDAMTRQLLAELLRSHHYIVTPVSNGQIGLEMAIAHPFDLILLDILIPGCDGMSVCRQLRTAAISTPILMLTARNANSDVVQGLDAGADDYVTKPYDPMVLMARIRRLLRHHRTANEPKQLTWGDLALDPTSARVTYQRQFIALTPKEYSLLELFLQNPQRIFSRSAIIDRLWTIDDFPSESAVTNLIKDLRRKLRGAGLLEEIVETVYGLGYRLSTVPKTSSLSRPQTSSGIVDSMAAAQLKRDFATIQRVLQRYQGTLIEQLTPLEQLDKSWRSRHTLSPQMQQDAQRVAHQLVGSLGTFGYETASHMARDIEHLFMGSTLGEPQRQRFALLLEQLRQELTQPNTTAIDDLLAEALYATAV
ncbi:MAG: response regulator [Kaiparowitsia implicata GSE-PSE-MK54-09C]|jgi:DNA-binding response OmpR family regulator|nr:response regulator [Kaiparowitsia implicata GSE-PSE-MK54-09C]